MILQRRFSLSSNQHKNGKQPRATAGFTKEKADTPWNKILGRIMNLPLPISFQSRQRLSMVSSCILTMAMIYIVVIGTLDLVGTLATVVSTAPIPEELVSHPPLLPEVDILPFNGVYEIPESHPQVGDRSDAYVRLRKDIDRRLPFSPSRSLNVVKELQSAHATNYSVRAMTSSDKTFQQTYDIYNCPHDPPTGYPFAWSMASILTAWPPRDTSQPPERALYQGLCAFQYPRDLAKAQNYHDREQPFVIRGDPHVARTVERWNQPGYISAILGGRHRTEYSHTNNFMYRRPGSAPQEGATELQWMTYDDWLTKANVTDKTLVDPDHEHWYFRLIGCGHSMGDHCDQESSEYLFDELPFFQPTHEHSSKTSSLSVTQSTHLYMGDHGNEQRGLHCRFGMQGVIADNHFDTTRNAIALLGGSRRYILAHPDQCSHMSLYDNSHPSARHSNFDWSTGDASTFPEDFRANAKGNEVVLQAGDVLYLPTFWFHYIISLELNYQCNTRSGFDHQNVRFIDEC